MPFKRILNMDVYEIIRRWHNQQTISYIAQILDYDRKTVRKYIHYAVDQGISLDQPLPAKGQVIELMQDVIITTQRIAPAQQILKPYLPEIAALVNDKQLPLKPKIAFDVICQRHDLADTVSYSSFKRFVNANHIVILPQRSTCRIEVQPGSEVQIDYAKMGLLYDPLTNKRRIVYAFIATLSHSRHKYVEFVYKQDQRSFVASNVRMLEYFGGVPHRIKLDNLKSGVIAPDLYDPQLNRCYREMAEHYNCFIDPCRVRHARDQGKVERDVQTIRDQFKKLLVINPQLDIQQASQQIRHWLIHSYGQTKHGTTGCKPYVIFIEIEQPALKALPTEPFVMAQWKQATVHPDHYIQFNKKFYSVPHAYVGNQVWVRGTDKIVQIYVEDKLIKQHVVTNGCRHTDWNDFPPNVPAALDDGLPLQLQSQAEHVGPKFKQLVRQVLQPHAFLNLRKAQGLVNLSTKFDHGLIEQAAAVALDQNIRVTLKNFQQLLQRLASTDQSSPPLPISQQSLQFIRDMSYFIHQS